MEMFAILTISIQHRGCTISYCNFARCSHWGKLSKAYMESLCIISHNCTAAAAAKSLQSCLTLCDPIDGSPPGSPVPWILQARTLEWVAISFSNALKWKVKVKSQCYWNLLGTTTSCKALCMHFITLLSTVPSSVLELNKFGLQSLDNKCLVLQ